MVLIELVNEHGTGTMPPGEDDEGFIRSRVATMFRNYSNDVPIVIYEKLILNIPH